MPIKQYIYNKYNLPVGFSVVTSIILRHPEWFLSVAFKSKRKKKFSQFLKYYHTLQNTNKLKKVQLLPFDWFCVVVKWELGILIWPSLLFPTKFKYLHRFPRKWCFDIFLYLIYRTLRFAHISDDADQSHFFLFNTYIYFYKIFLLIADKIMHFMNSY